MNTSSFAAALGLLVAVVPVVSARQDIVHNLRSTAADASVSAERDPVALQSSATPYEEANSIQTERLLGGAYKECCGHCVCLNKNGNPMQKWCSTGGSAPYYHENYRYKKGTSSVKTNDISIFEYLENAIDVDCVTALDSGVTTATLTTQFTCTGGGTTTWRVGKGSGGVAPCSEDSYGSFDVEWTMIDDIGLMMKFTLADTAYEGAVGYVTTLFGGQNQWYDFGNAINGWCLGGASGHLQVVAHEVENIAGEDCNADGFSLSWDHDLNKSGGNIQLPADGKTVIQMGRSLNNVGFTTTNCGPYTNAKAQGQISWTINEPTLLDSLNGSVCPSGGPPAPAAVDLAEEVVAVEEGAEQGVDLFGGSA